MSYIFGPVPSRRLGLSLGVDLIPPKTCTYDCLYCEVGRTTRHTLDTGPFVGLNEIAGELETALLKNEPDTITLAGSGEPTLNSEIDSIISFIKKKTDIRIALLTNGSLFWKDDVLSKALDADIILPTFSTVFESTYKAIHRPCKGLDVSVIMRGLKDLRRRFKGLIFLEVILLSGLNDTDTEIEGLREAIADISPDRIQLNTVVRPPSDPRAMPTDMARMEEIKDFLGSRAEVIGYPPSKKKSTGHDSDIPSVIEMAKRRPVRLIDIAEALNKTQDDAEQLIKGMIIKGYLSEKRHGEEIFFIAK
ncbi:MAG: radical SAM protein [Deltaproteobacteria bacterium]|nr:radical SAM protein [Deltaproteobacteria bacterium]